MAKKPVSKKTPAKKIAPRKSVTGSTHTKKSISRVPSIEKPGTPSKPFPIVAIGASAGGLEAITELLKNLSPKTGMAFVFIQHMDPSHESLLPSILSRYTRMKVLEATEKMKIEPDHVYLMPPNKDMHIIDGMLKLDQRPPRHAIHMPIDRFFNSLAEKHTTRAFGIVLSGNANDGSQGLKAIKMAGGFTFAQDESAKFSSMPLNAIAEGGVDRILSPKDIAHELVKFSQNASLAKPIYKVADDDFYDQEDESTLRIILDMLYKSKGVDFMNYKRNTITRRVFRRMLLNDKPSLKMYLAYLKQEPGEITKLYQDLLINVTEFFRDPPTLEFIRNKILPKLLNEKPSSSPIRIWVPACSTGQEAYSLAIILTEWLEEKGMHIPFQIFATDLSESAVDKARSGVYTKLQVAEISRDRLQRFFSPVNDHYRVSKQIRELCVFAQHNLLKDPPFSHIDLISCCNLLIYLEPELQKRVIHVFHYALNPKGFLVLGKSETIVEKQHFFLLANKQFHVYQHKKENNTQEDNGLSFTKTSFIERRSQLVQQHGQIFERKIIPGSSPNLESKMDILLLNRFVPASVLINEDFEILHVRGSTGLFLEPAPGKASLNLLKMARAGLEFELRSAIQIARKTKRPYQKKEIEIKADTGDHVRLVSLEVVPVQTEKKEMYFLIVFRESEQRHDPRNTPVSRDKQILKLEKALRSARDNMQLIVEDLEATNEALQSANEEIVSSNEELQCINEELETSKEEVESSNEELMTINQELYVKNYLLAEANLYSESIVNTIREPFVILYTDLRVKYANPAFYRVFRVTEVQTEGRLIYEIGNRQWDIPKLRQFLEETISKDTTFHGFEVTHDFPSIGEKTMILNASKIKQKIQGQDLILMAIEDVTEKIEAQKVTEDREALFRNIANSAPVMISTSDQNGNRNFFNKTYLEFTGKTMTQLQGTGWTQDINPLDRDEFLKLYHVATKRREPYKSEFRLLRNDNTYRWVMSIGQPLHDINHNFIGFISSITEIHDQYMINKELEIKVNERTRALNESNLNLRQSNNELQQFTYIASHDLQEPLRKIYTFADILEEREAGGLSENGKGLLEKMKAVALRMQALINDLLSYSKTTSDERKFEHFPAGEIIQSVIEEFHEELESRNAIIENKVDCDLAMIPLQFRQLFQNLVSNALKYANPKRKLHVRITSEIIDGKDASTVELIPGKSYCHITFTDNGIGFDPQYNDKIFELFQRLHGREEYSGTGIGLAIVKRILVIHNGFITASGKPGKGATFDIYLPVEN